MNRPIVTSDLTFSGPRDVEQRLAGRARELRLLAGWRQETLALRSGVTLASLRRFERTGLISFTSLLKIAHALGRLDDFAALLSPPAARSIDELQQRAVASTPKRGRR